MDDVPFSYEDLPSLPDNVIPGQVRESLPDITDPGAVISAFGQGIEEIVPGSKVIVDLLKNAGILPAILKEAIDNAESIHPMHVIRPLLKHAPKFIRLLEIGYQDFWTIIGDVGIGGIFISMLEGGLGVSTSKFEKDEWDAVQTVDRMVGFATSLPFVIAAIDASGKALLANRWPEAISEALKKIPEEMGMSWALGLVIDEAFKAAMGTVLEEAINKQKRPNRLAWQQVRVMLKQHILEDKDMQDVLEHQGYPDKEIGWIKKLADQTIPLPEIAQLWFREWIDEPEAKKLITSLGYNEQQSDWLYDLYISKAETSASATIRTTARQAFINHLITEGAYRKYLQEADYPDRLIDDDIKAIGIEQDIGRVLHSAATIKARFLHHAIDEQEAQKELRELNYSDEYITELLQTWQYAPIKRSHGLSQAKLLSYLISGVLTPALVRPLLLATGLDAESTDFLIAHPVANGQAKLHKLSPGLVTQAYVDGALQPDELEDAYKRANVDPSVIGRYVAIAQYKLSHRKGSPTYTVTPGEADYRAAFKVGIIDFPQLVVHLEKIGYSPEDAMLLAEITNKGPDVKPPAPPFKDVSQAIAYLVSKGASIYAPPDPLLQQAEMLLEQYGYSFSFPYTTPTPILIPPGIAPGGGGEGTGPGYGPPPTVPPGPPPPLPS